jgi:(S)-ureidoglycine aminohydrolase
VPLTGTDMRFASIFSFLFCCCTSLFAQTQPLVSKVYTWDNSPASSKKVGAVKEIFNGSGAILSNHEMRGFMLDKGKSRTYKANQAERFFIIKNGPVKVTLDNKEFILDRGSIIFVLPGDQVTIENNGSKEAAYYLMTYQSKQPADAERGKKAGPSFVMNWNDMVVKPTEKGSTRQLFDRQTAMLNRFDIHVTQLNQGFNSHPPHTHVNEEIILMLGGNAEMQIGTEHQKANDGDVVLLNSMVPHNLTNIGTTPCLYFAIQWN